jgi:predicted O-methyltransferase YrrM
VRKLAQRFETNAHSQRIRAFLDDAYDKQHVLDESGRPVRLEPDSISREAGDALRELAVSEGATRTLEVGLGVGLGTLFLCDAVIESGDPDASHVTIDPFQREHYGNAGLLAIRNTGCGELVTFLAEESQAVLPRLLSDGQRFDFAYIDGDHRFESVFLDLYYTHHLIPAGGTVVVDDAWLQAVRLTVSFFERNLGYELRDGVMPGGFAWRRRRNPLRRGRAWRGSVAVLQKPLHPPPRDWRSFEPFCG